MTHVLLNNKRVDILRDQVIVSSYVDSECFDNPYDVSSPARLFFEGETFIGVARLKDGDTDNVREAVHIAESKMERQYYRFIASRLKKEKREVTASLEKIDKVITKAERNIESCTRHIKDIAKNMT